MTQKTYRGHALARRLNPYMGTTDRIIETCSLIARHATSYSRIQEAWCSDERTANEESWFSRSLAKREASLEARIGSLVRDLPDADGGPLSVRFQGDPRGHTVKIVLRDDRGYEQEIGCD